MRKLVLAILATFAIMYLVPVAVYGPLSMITGLEPPSDGDPIAFMIGVAVLNLGTATVFVLIFYYARNVFAERWLLYAFLWWVMYVFGEVEPRVRTLEVRMLAWSPGYTWLMAVGGITSETVYLPLSAYVTKRLTSEE